jgi:hypothetical protein
VLSQIEQEALSKQANFNQLVFRILQGEEATLGNTLERLIFSSSSREIPPSLLAKLLNPARRQYVRFRLGLDLYNAKRRAIPKKHAYDNTTESMLRHEEKEILKAAYQFVGRGGDNIKYEFVARNLLSGFRIEDKTPVTPEEFKLAVTVGMTLDRTQSFESDLKFAPEYESFVMVASPLFLALV